VGKASPGKERGTVTARKLQTAREFNPAVPPAVLPPFCVSEQLSLADFIINSAFKGGYITISGAGSFPSPLRNLAPSQLVVFPAGEKLGVPLSRGRKLICTLAVFRSGDGMQTASCRGSDFLMNYLGQLRRSCQLARASLTRI